MEDNKMIAPEETELNKLSMKQQWFLQQLYKRRTQGQVLNEYKSELAKQFDEQWLVALKTQKSKRPIIIMLIIGGVLSILYKTL